MIKVERYEKYKKLKGYEYVNEIPDNWELLPNIAIFSERINKGHSDEELLSVTIGKGIIRQSDIESKKDSSNEDKSNYKLVKTGDIAYNKMRMWQGAVGASSFTGIVSPAYIVLKRKTVMNPEYFHYQFRTNFFNNYSKRFSYGLCDDQLNLRYKDFKRMYSIVPPFEIQNRIVVYLNKKTQQANSLIEKQERLIDLLKEEKKVIISKAVTKGINPDVEMKDSGIEWLGEIPQHWEIYKIKHLKKVISKGTTPSTEGMDIVNSGIRFIKAENISESGVLDFPQFFIDELTHNALKRSQLMTNDILIVIAGATIGKVSIIREEQIPANMNQAVAFIRLKNLEMVEYVYYWLKTNYIEKQMHDYSVQSAQPNLSMQVLGNFFILLQPIEEQKQIVQYIEKQVININKAIEQAQREITLIKDYIESLIYNAITGQIKV